MQLFDYQTAAKEAGLSDAQLAQICELVRRDFPRDDMLYELHVLRVCHAIRDGRITFDQALEPESAPGGGSIA